MNRPAHAAKKFSARIVFAASALILFFQAAANVHAQDRWLMIFENSSAMKKRMPAVNQELKSLFFSNVEGAIHGGDSLGVWTFDQTLHVGEFQLSTWDPGQAATTASNLVTFLSKRSYRGDVNFNALQPVLNEVATGSHRLTVLIFCEGQGDVIWTPYNDGINHTLRENYAERKKNGQPFVIVLRVQDGKYCGCSINFPPGGVNFPAFPALMEPPKSEVDETKVVAVPEKKHAPVDNTPLVIVGKNVGTNLADLPPLPPKTPAALPSAAPLSGTNNSSATNGIKAIIEAATAPVAVATITNLAAGSVVPARPSSAVPPQPAVDSGYRFLIMTGVLALISAVALVIFLIARSQQPRGSLISDSMNSPSLPLRKD